MRILVLTDYYPPHTGGGVEKVVEETVTRMAAAGHEIAVVTGRTAGGSKVDHRGRLTIFRAPVLQLTRHLRAQVALSPAMMPLAVKVANQFKPHIIHAHNIFFFGAYAVAPVVKLQAGVPLVTSLHLAGLDRLGILPRTLATIHERTLGQPLLRLSDQLLCVSNAVADHALKRGVSSNRLIVVPNGVDSRRFHPSPDEIQTPPVVLFVGRLIFNKGPMTFIDAAANVLRHRSDVRFLLVGDGPLRASLRERIRDYDIDANVHLLGNRSDVPELMRTAALFARPSLIEGMPLTVLEAMASGLPVIASPVGGTPELVKDGETGLLVDGADAVGLSSAITRLLDDDALRASMGIRARGRVLGEFSWEWVANQTLEVYRHWIRQPGGDERTLVDSLGRGSRLGGTRARPE